MEAVVSGSVGMVPGMVVAAVVCVVAIVSAGSAEVQPGDAIRKTVSIRIVMALFIGSP